MLHTNWRSIDVHQLKYMFLRNTTHDKHINTLTMNPLARDYHEQVNKD